MASTPEPFSAARRFLEAEAARFAALSEEEIRYELQLQERQRRLIADRDASMLHCSAGRDWDGAGIRPDPFPARAALSASVPSPATARRRAGLSDDAPRGSDDFFSSTLLPLMAIDAATHCVVSHDCSC